MNNKYTQDMTGTGQHVELPDPGPEPKDIMIGCYGNLDKVQNGIKHCLVNLHLKIS